MDDDIHNHPKARAAGPYAMGVWAMCGAWVAKNLTDGWVPESQVREQGGKNWRKAARSLVDVGLWRPQTRERGKNGGRTEEDVTPLHGHGFVFHDYHDYNPTREQVLAEREAAAARQRAARDRAKQRRHGVTGKKRHGVTPDRTGESVTVPPSLPPSGGDGRARTTVTPGPTTDKPMNGIDRKPTHGPHRSPDVERLMAETRQRLPRGRPLRNTPPVDEPPRRSA